MPSGEYDECPQIGQVFGFGCGTRGVGFLLFMVFTGPGLAQSHRPCFGRLPLCIHIVFEACPKLLLLAVDRTPA